jgi:hypothetical protein
MVIEIFVLKIYLKFHLREKYSKSHQVTEKCPK